MGISWWMVVAAPFCVIGTLGIARWAVVEWRFGGIFALAVMWTFLRPATFVLSTLYGGWVAYLAVRKILSIPEVRQALVNLDTSLPQIPIPKTDANHREDRKTRSTIHDILASLKNERLKPARESNVVNTPRVDESSVLWTQADPHQPASIPPSKASIPPSQLN